MALKETWDNIRLSSLLKADAFEQDLKLLDQTSGKWISYIDRKSFFSEIYVEVTDKRIEITDGAKRNLRSVSLKSWMDDELLRSNNSLVIFIEGYAGCGKSVFVQNLLRTQLNSLEYDNDYYNYDIGAYYDNQNTHRIESAIRECFLRQMASHILEEKLDVIEEFRKLMSQEVIRYLDSDRKIFYKFTNTETYQVAVDRLVKTKDREVFQAALHDLMEGFNCEQLLAIDCIFRVAEYSVRGKPQNPALYICYDNLDAIENFDELTKFHNTLIALRRNVDRYIIEIDGHFRNIPSPHFVILSTYRKITLSRVESSLYAERYEDYGEDNRFIQHIDASHFYQYSQLVVKRKNYFLKYINSIDIKVPKIRKRLTQIAKILSMGLIQKRYAGLWNNNYRTCSDIFDTLYCYHETELKECLKLLKMNEDGYDEVGASYYGASAAFLNLICRIFKREEIWGANHLALVPLTLRTAETPASKLTSLSRLILTYIGNTKDDQDKPEPVSIKSIFEEFGSLFSADDICTCLSNLLTRDKTGTWRRPIFYHRNAINTGTIRDSLKEQWDHYQIGDSYNYTEFLMCDCGYAHINRVIFEFEFFSVRLNGIDQKPLYFMNNPQDLKNIVDLITKVQRAVGNCCQNMIYFKSSYMEKLKVRDNSSYIKSLIHPRTKLRNPQLHTERVIFSHIAYLDHCRRYFINKQELDFNQAKEICKPFFDGIEQYLALYSNYIAPINPKRKSVFEELQQKLSIVRHAENKNDLLQHIEM